MTKISNMHAKLNKKPKSKWRNTFINAVKASLEDGYKNYSGNIFDDDAPNPEDKALYLAICMGVNLIKENRASLEQIYDASWEAFNGLLQAECVKMNIQDNLGLDITPLNINLIQC